MIIRSGAPGRACGELLCASLLAKAERDSVPLRCLDLGGSPCSLRSARLGSPTACQPPLGKRCSTSSGLRARGDPTALGELLRPADLCNPSRKAKIRPCHGRSFTRSRLSLETRQIESA